MRTHIYPGPPCINVIDCIFCADNCNEFMKISNTTSTSSVNGQFSQEIRYNHCFCHHGIASLRCNSEETESCDPDKCFTYYHYERKNASCEENVCNCNLGDTLPVPNNECLVHNSIQCQPIASIPTCEETQHYDLDTKKCEENICICPYGTLKTESCLKHGAYNCELEKCEDFASTA